MIYEMLNREMIFPNVEATDFEDVLRQLGGAATKAGYAKATYAGGSRPRDRDSGRGFEGACGVHPNGHRR